MVGDLALNQAVEVRILGRVLRCDWSLAPARSHKPAKRGFESHRRYCDWTSCWQLDLVVTQVLRGFDSRQSPHLTPLSPIAREALRGYTRQE